MTEPVAFGEALARPPMIFERRGDMGPESEKRMIRAAKRGSREAVEALARVHWADAYATAIGLLGDPAAAEDVAQEGMLAAINALDRFDRRRPFAPWLHRIVANKALDVLRSKKRRRETALDEDQPEISPTGRSGELMDALSKLDERQRTIVVLRHLAGFSTEEVGQALELSPAAVRSALHRAVAKLRIELGDPAPPTHIESEEQQ